MYRLRGMGRKKKDRAMLTVRVNPETPERLKEIALRLGCVYNGSGSVGQLLDVISQLLTNPNK